MPYLIFLMAALVGTQDRAGGIASPDSKAGDHPIFDRFLADSTIRIDFYHGGDLHHEFVTLDRLSAYDTWAGSRVHLRDPFEVGRYVAEITDVNSGLLLYSKRFDSYFGEYKTTAEAANRVGRIYHETVLIPRPRGKFRLAIKVRQRDEGHKSLLDAELDPDAYTVSRELPSSGVKVFEVLRSGDSHQKIDVAIVAEGYTEQGAAKVASDLGRFTKLLFSQEPFASSKDRFNIRGVWKPSQESGSDEPSRGLWKNTSIGTSFDALGTERYMLTEENRSLRDIAANVPYDAIYIMVNHPRYGGGGIYNLFCTFTTDNQWSPYIFLHEFGHSFAGLTDEYYTSAVAYNDLFPKGVEPKEANITALLDPKRLKWNDLVTPHTPIPTPWEKASYDAKDKAYQKVRQEMNAKVAEATRGRLDEKALDQLKLDVELLSSKHSEMMDLDLARSKFVGQVGAFEGAGYASQGLYRPALDCIMFSKGTKPFCPVCQRAIRRVIDYYGE